MYDIFCNVGLVGLMVLVGLERAVLLVGLGCRAYFLSGVAVLGRLWTCLVPWGSSWVLLGDKWHRAAIIFTFSGAGGRVQDLLIVALQFSLLLVSLTLSCSCAVMQKTNRQILFVSRSGCVGS